MNIERRTYIPPKRFQLVRTEDISGVSGTGVVACGVMFDDRKSVVHWNSVISSITTYEDIDDVVKIHGHDNATELEWLD